MTVTAVHRLPFRRPGAFAKGRLGNEAENYGEFIFSKNFYLPGAFALKRMPAGGAVPQRRRVSSGAPLDVQPLSNYMVSYATAIWPRRSLGSDGESNR